MSKSIRNTTAGAVKVPLPHGKALRLGPHQSGHISHHDLDHPPLKKLIEAGTVEIEDAEPNEAIPGRSEHGRAPFDA